jgi:hypothetical protein
MFSFLLIGVQSDECGMNTAETQMATAYWRVARLGI